MVARECPARIDVILRSSHAISNPDIESERRLLTQLAPEVSEDLITRLISAFHDLRKGYENGSLTYPYSLRGARYRFYID
jgi:hypothetical protein